jgi:hypothetical protein
MRYAAMDVSNKDQAEALVTEQVLARSEHDFTILHDLTEVRDFGWVVFYTTRRFLETHDPSPLVPGTGPVAVTRDGNVVPLTTSVPPQQSIARFEAEWRKTNAFQNEVH